MNDLVSQNRPHRALPVFAARLPVPLAVVVRTARCVPACLPAAGRLSMVLLLSLAASSAHAVMTPVTPTPALESASGCKAVVTLSWDVSSIPDTRRVRWELKRDSDFTNLEGAEPGALDSRAVGGVTGSVTLDLRNYGPTLDGTRYFLRIVAKGVGGADVARRSDSRRFDLDVDMRNALRAQTEPRNREEVRLDWRALPSDVKACLSHIRYDVRRRDAGVAAGITDRASGTVPTPPGGGRVGTVVNMTRYAAGEYVASIAGQWQNAGATRGVGGGSAGVTVTVGETSASAGRGLEAAPVTGRVIGRPVSPPRILAIQVNNGARRVEDAQMRVNLTTAGARPTHYIVAENGGFSGADWRDDFARSASQIAFRYRLQNTSPGQKTLWFKLKSNSVESEPHTGVIDFQQMANQELDDAFVMDEVLRFSQQQGFSHTAEALTPWTRCEVGIDEGMVLLLPDTGDSDLNPDLVRVCRYTLFSGRSLHPDWALREIRIKPGSAFRLVGVERRGGGMAPHTTFTIDDGGEKPKSRGFGLPPPTVLGGANIELTLRGPAGANWRDGFRR